MTVHSISAIFSCGQSVQETAPFRRVEQEGSPELPESVQDVFGSALLDVQYGDHPHGARPFGEGLPREVMKLVEDYDGSTFRAAYTASFPQAAYVLHVFRKKSSSGIATPKPDKATVLARFKAAEQHYRRTYGTQE